MTHSKLSRSLVIFASAALIAAAPLMSFAKDGNNGGRADVGGNGQAWGHQVAPGWFMNWFNWFNHNGTTTRPTPPNTDHPKPTPPGIDRHQYHPCRNDGDEDGDTDDMRNCMPSPTPTPTPSPTTSPTPTPTPAPSALVVSNINAQVIGQTEALITWNTNNSANSTVWYSTSTPVATTTAASVTSATDVYNHSVLLTGLSASTTYYFIIGSTDAFGNVGTSAEATFMTTAAPFTNPLAITNALAMVGSTGVTLTWTTNEAADSEAYYSTVSPVVIGASSTTPVTNSSLITSHSLSVTGLATSTTYYMFIQSKDAANNTQSTSQFSFTTGS
ncbi:MAG: fibronectin type III domain-containing protein [Patescibacteria group bacterium]|nr:fibronectin type III domain-containing protein [Patescibacteria group bacterium]